MFRKEFAEVISKTGMIPAKDLRPLIGDTDPKVISEFGLSKLEFFDDLKFAKQLGKNYNVIFIDLSKAKIRESTVNLVKKRDAIKYRALPIQKTSKSISLAIYDPTVMDLQVELQTIFQHPIEFIITNISSWKKIFESIQESLDELLSSIVEVKKSDADEIDVTEDENVGDDIIRYVNKILTKAYLEKASDIHFEQYEKALRIRFRIDGTLREEDRPNIKMARPITSRLKILADLDISEKRKPQDGRIKLLIGGNPIEYRVSTLPCLFGEKVVLRLLDQGNLQLNLKTLNFEKDQLKVFEEGIFKPYGMCLVTGPTGSGKSTTLYSVLSELNDPLKNISTAEDPVEFNLEGINQVNIKKSIGFTFTTTLKAFLRQDPDIIMVGEIRDMEVGEIAFEAALTGHLVLSTLHTNDAPSAITRLINMGIEPFLVVASLNVVVAQKLCRKICKFCRIEDKRSIQELVNSGFTHESAKKVKIYRGDGCKHCGESGAKGRIAIHEVLSITPKIKDVILKTGNADEIKKLAIREGMKTMRMSALIKVARGLITLDEAVMSSASDKF